jgi:hypothetical protein
VTVVTRLGELLVNVPFPGGHGPRVHSRVTVVVELVVLPRTVFTTVTVHFMPVEAPSGVAAWPLHWSMVRVAACADDGDMAATANENNPASSRAMSTACPARRRAEPGARSVVVAILITARSFLKSEALVGASVVRAGCVEARRAAEITGLRAD